MASLSVLLCWPLSMRARQQDSFVHIGLCWLNGRSEFCPPPLSCGTRCRSLFVLLCWPLSMRPRQHGRFVLIGLCWLNGRSAFRPPILQQKPDAILARLFPLLCRKEANSGLTAFDTEHTPKSRHVHTSTDRSLHIGGM